MPEERELAALRAENERLREELAAVAAAEARDRAYRKKVTGFGGRLLLPLLDRTHVVRSFVHLFRVATAYAGPRDTWPARQELVDAAEAFGVAAVRFAIRRRAFLLAFSILALVAPGVQIWLVWKQNELINTQNEFIKIQADDIVARGVTSEAMLTNELNGALLSGREVQALNRTLRRIFTSDLGQMTGGDTAEGKRLFLDGTAGRAHLLLALGKALKAPVTADGRPLSAAVLWDLVADSNEGAFTNVARESADRLFVTLSSPRSAFAGSARLEIECQRYVFGLSTVLRSAWAVAVSADERETYFRRVRSVFERASAVPLEAGSPLLSTFRVSFQELLLDLALEPRFGEPEPGVPGKEADALVRKGFEALRRGLQASGKGPEIRWDHLRKLLEIPG